MALPANVKRGKRAARIIRAEYKNDSRGLCKEDVVDLIADVLHLCEAEGFGFYDVLRIANNHFNEEREGHE